MDFRGRTTRKWIVLLAAGLGLAVDAWALWQLHQVREDFRQTVTRLTVLQTLESKVGQVSQVLSDPAEARTLIRDIGETLSRFTASDLGLTHVQKVQTSVSEVLNRARTHLETPPATNSVDPSFPAGLPNSLLVARQEIGTASARTVEHLGDVNRAMDRVWAISIALGIGSLCLILAAAGLSWSQNFNRRRRVEVEKELKHTVSVLHDAQNRYRALADNNAVGFWESDLDGVTRYINPAMCRMLEVESVEEVLGQKLESFFTPDSAETIRHQHELRRRGTASSYEVEIVGRKAGRRHALVFGAPVTDRSGRVRTLIGTFTDITEYKRLEQQVRLSAKMQAIGSLAGGIAHDFNNLMTVIMGYCDLVSQQASLGRDAQKHVDGIQKAAERATSLTKQLLAFSRRQVMRPEVLDLNVVVSDMNKMLRRLIGEHIALVTRHSDVGFIKADPGQIEQIILNLAVNSRDAMAEGGTLTIETANVRLEREERDGVIIQPGDYVMLSVRDTGSGMSPEVKVHIFEPFFTTKEPGKGTGLGLSTVYGIVKQSGGYVFVESAPRMGSTFRVYLPRVFAVEATEQLRKEMQIRHVRGQESILVVEDEEDVRTIVREFLEWHGYRVLEAANGRQALDLSRAYSGPIDLVLTDIIMPEMGGVELSRELSKVRPQIPIIFMSGYAQSSLGVDNNLDAGTVLLEKPFSSDTLIATVRQVLDLNFSPNTPS